MQTMKESKTMNIDKIQELLGKEADGLLNYQCKAVPKEKITSIHLVSTTLREPGLM